MRALLAILLTVAGALPASAQVTARADAAVGSAGPTPATGGLWTVGSQVEWLRPSFRLYAEGEYREFDARGSGSFGRLVGSWYRPLAPVLTAELTAEASGLTHPGRRAQGLFTGGGRFHFHGADRGLWLGSQVGKDGLGAVVRWEGAAWRRFGEFTLQLQGSQTSLRDIVRETTAPDSGLPLPDTLRRETRRVHTDVGAWMSWQRGALALSGAIGRRFGVTEPGGDLRSTPGNGDGLSSRRATSTGAVTWWSIEGRWWITSTFGLVGAAGYQPPDGSLRTPGGRFGKFGITAALPRGRRPGSSAHFPATVAKAPGAAALATIRLPGDSVEFRLSAPRAMQVELMADFTGWTPLPLIPIEGGFWAVRQGLTPGRYAVNIRYDGGPWQPPPGLPVVEDEFGGNSGVVVVQ
jgi:hypothetical protein